MRESRKPDTPDPVRLETRNVPANQSRIGPSLHIKGEISGSEDLLIDGSLEGIVQLENQKLTLGPMSKVTADLTTPQISIEDGACFKGSIEIEKAAEKETEQNSFSATDPVQKSVAHA